MREGFYEYKYYKHRITEYFLSNLVPFRNFQEIHQLEF